LTKLQFADWLRLLILWANHVEMPSRQLTIGSCHSRLLSGPHDLV